MKLGDCGVIIRALNNFKKGRCKKVSSCSVRGMIVENL